MRKYLTLKEAAEAYPVFSYDTLKRYRCINYRNFSDVCTRQVRQKVLVDTEALEEWIDNEGGFLEPVEFWDKYTEEKQS